MIRAGALDRQLTIYRRTIAKNNLNEDIETFIALATVAASRKDVSDSEKVAAQQVGAEISTRFQVRWSVLLSDLDPKDRCRCDGRTFEIVGVKELGRREGIEISATARADQAELYE